VAYRLSSEVFDAAYVSDLDRTKETASYIFPYHKNLVVNYDPRLREKSGGVLEGKALGTPSIEAKVFTFKRNLESL
jgi:broad specificity phosphatase PhoE